MIKYYYIQFNKGFTDQRLPGGWYVNILFIFIIRKIQVK